VNSALSYISKQKTRQKKSVEYGEFVQMRQDSGTKDTGSMDIAEATGLTESNVRVRIHRAKDRLKALIEKEKS